MIAAIGTALFWATDDYLKQFAVEVNHTNVDANASRDNIQTLQKIQDELAAKRSIVDRASSIVAESKSYQYQDQIIKDLNDYATKSGISIINLDFSDKTAPATGSPAGAQAPATVAPVINGVKSISVNVAIKNPVSYTNMLKFIQSIEQNLTKMQISKISFTRDATGGITSDTFALEVYTR